MEATAEIVDLLLRLNDHDVSKECFERKLSARNVILRPMTASVKRLDENLNSLENAKRLVEKTNEGADEKVR